METKLVCRTDRESARRKGNIKTSSRGLISASSRRSPERFPREPPLYRGPAIPILTFRLFRMPSITVAMLC